MVGIKRKPTWERQVLQNPKVLVEKQAKHIPKDNGRLCLVS